MLMMSVGLVETVKLVSGYEWVRVLRRIDREQQQGAKRKEQWQQHAREIAQRLVTEHQVGGVGLIGSLLRGQTLNRWSQIRLVLWDVPDEFNIWAFTETVSEDIPVELIEAVWALPGAWEEIAGKMETLAGSRKPHGPRPQERTVFHWLSTSR